jgi:hypothetical protein
MYGQTKDSLTFINSDHNSISNLNITSATDIDDNGDMRFVDSTDNSFENDILLASVTKVTGFYNYSVNNLFKDCIYSYARDYIDGTSQLIRGWSFTGKVIDKALTPMQGATINFRASNPLNQDVYYRPTISYVYSNCYQESANVTNQSGTDGNCSLSYAGGYAANAAEMIDGNWSSQESSFVSPLIITYIKPANVTNNSVWQSKVSILSTDYAYNLSIPQDCWNYSSTNLTLSITPTTNVSINATWSCYNGTFKILQTIMGDTNHPLIYEDAMIWNIANEVSTPGAVLSYGTLGGLTYTNSPGYANATVIQYMDIYGIHYESSPYYFNASYGVFAPTVALLDVEAILYHEFILGDEIASSSLSRTAMWLLLGIIFLIGIAASIGFFMVRMREGYSVVDIWKYFIILVIWLTIFTVIYFVLAWFIMGSFYPRI